MNKPTTIKTTLALTTALLLATTAGAQELTFAVDVPSDLGRDTFLANQTIHHDAGSYSLEFDGPVEGMGPDININALDLLESGGFLFSTDTPFSVAGTTYLPRDIVRFDGVAYSLYLDGDDLLLSDSADIDALSRTPDGDLVISLAAPETLDGSSFEPGDLIRVTELVTPSMFLSAATMGLPPGCNVIGAEVLGNADARVQFDAPVELGGTTYLPGDVAEYSGGGFSLFFRDTSFPAYAAATDFGLPASPGDATNLFVSKNGGDLDLSWSASCSSAATDYAIYEGTLGDFDSHLPNVCTTLGLTSSTITPNAGDRYFLVVPLSPSFEGDYGEASPGFERPQTAGACIPAQKVRECA